MGHVNRIKIPKASRVLHMELQCDRRGTVTKLLNQSSETLIFIIEPQQNTNLDKQIIYNYRK